MALVSLPIRGAWIEIPTTCATLAARSRRSPSGERGLKSRPRWGIRGLRGSLPIRGAWIEIATGRDARGGTCRSPSGERGLKCFDRIQQVEFGGRSPSGERGLKLRFEFGVGHLVGRSPSGERGLKLRMCMRWSFRLLSLPIRGAWIEIRSCTGDVSVSGGRSPSGERGLKFEPAVGRIVVVGQVAPHPGSVD